ncbi:Glyoxylate reductase/hydroxypyruvate reductase [Phytophthora nicotianae]|uniref:Glyoxylate reductase/hydroxypyruvate reductase n=1 Tax=Phytophthora nicotianae TaxID=4792 RepID=A0A0W8D8A1_PHYNI|nr:Glyoxylate reductase/hydroxypyruvate reductase [Phytophthora nicotianae]
MERTQLSKNELLAAAAFGGVVAVGNDGGSDSSRTDYVEKLALAEETLETKAEEAAQQALTRYREQSGHEYAFLIFEVDGVALPRVELELFHGVCPKTCKNFLALCEHKVPDLSDETQQLGYQGNQVHRVVRGGWIQAGDVAGNGRGDGPCRSLYGLEFPDESFAVSHNAAGILSMANTGPHTNGSQFFITLAPQPWLDRRKVAFGRVMYCVRCDQFVVTEEEAKKQAEQEAEELAATEKEEAEAEARREEERARRIEQQFRLEEQAKQAKEMQELEQVKARRATATYGAAKRKIDSAVSTISPDSDAEVNAIRRRTLAALYQVEHPHLF